MTLPIPSHCPETGWYSAKELADYFGTTKENIRHWRMRGWLEFLKVRRRTYRYRLPKTGHLHAPRTFRSLLARSAVTTRTTP